MNPLALKTLLSIAVFAAVFLSAGLVVRKYNAGQQAITQVAAADARADAAEKATALLAQAVATRDATHTTIRETRAATTKRIDHAVTTDPVTTEWASERLPDELRRAHLN